MKKLTSLLAFLFIAGLGSSVISQAGAASPAVATALAFLLVGMAAYAQRKYGNKNYTVAGINVELWLPQVVPTLFKNNEFLLQSTDHSAYVNGYSVHVPLSATPRDWEKNRAKGGAPATTYQRTDTVTDYLIAEWTSDPMLITNAEEVQLSYDKRASVLNEMMMKGKQTIADDVIYSWGATGASAANILRTSGIVNNDVTNGVVASSLSLVNSDATGSRKVFGLYDLRRAHKLLNSQNVPKEGRCMLMSSNMYDELMSDVITSKYRDAASVMDMTDGKVNRILGFDIYERSSVLTYTNAATPVKKAIGAVGAADDNDAVLFWQKDQVARAIGEYNLYYNAGQAVFYGDVMSALLRCGSTIIRSTEIGVGAIVQDAAN